MIEFLKKNILVLALFISTTLFFLFQNYFDFSWDFAAYLINAKYFFYGGNYFEVYRAPLISIILGPLLLLGKFSAYIYIFLISILFLYSSKRMSDALYEKYFKKFDIEKKTILFLFYFFSLNLFLLLFGLREGTELLGLSFFYLFLSNIILGKTSGHYLALAFLSRYNFFIFIPFLFLNRNFKKILKNFGLFFLIIFPWLLFNKIKWGNWFSSIADSFYLNIFSRLDMVEPLRFFSFLNVINWFFPFFIIGIAFFIWKIYYNKRALSNCKYEFLFIAVFAFLLYDVYTIPFKVTRYLFNFVLPIAFFSTLGSVVICKYLTRKQIEIFKIILVICFFVLVSILAEHSFKINEEDVMYKSAADKIIELNLTNCQILSPHWVPVNYYSGNVRFMYTGIKEGLEKNEMMLVFPGFPTMDDQFDQREIPNFPTLEKTPLFVIIANKNTTNENCIKSLDYSSPIIPNSCEILSMKFGQNTRGAFYKFCEVINFRNP